MNVLPRSRNVLCLAVVVGLLTVTPAAAQTAQFRTFLDLDNDPATGCTVTTADGSFTGVEERLTTTVDLGTEEITAVQSEVCVTPPATFGAPVAVNAPFAPTWNLGAGLGTGGSDVVETYTPLPAPLPDAVRLGFEVAIPNAGTDALLVTTGGGPIVLRIAVSEIPTVSELGLLVLAFFLAAGALVVLRRHHRSAAATFMAVFFVVACAGVLWAVTMPDGIPNGWPAPLATDPAGPVPDLAAAFAAEVGGNLMIRGDVFFTAPNTPPTITAVADQTIDEDISTGALAFTVGDAETTVAALVVTAASSDQALVPNGNLTLFDGGGGSWTIDVAPAAGLSGGPVTITVTVDDGAITTSTTFDVTVSPVDDPPTAVDDAATVTENDPATTIDALMNDVDPDGGPISVSAVTQPANATVVNNGTDVTYQPNADYCNDGVTTDDFTYTLTPGGSMATVRMTVTCGPDTPPTAVDDPATVTEDDLATTIDVLSNDTDPDGGPISIFGVTQPADGTVVNNGTDLTYQPDPDYCNDGVPTDDFTYTLTPGGSTATVRVTVTCVDDPPTAVDDPATVAEDAPATAIAVLANDTDGDGGPISITTVTQPTNGTVVITGGGSGLTYQPDPSYCNDGVPTDDLTYTLTPGGSTATVRVTVTCVDDPPTAVDDPATVTEDALATAIDVLANDTDSDGGPISITGVTQPTNGTVLITGGGTGLTYQPDPNYCNGGVPTDDFTYTLTPGGSVGTVQVTVNCVADPPMAVADGYTTVGNTELVVAGATPTSLARVTNATSLLANDSDPIEMGAISVVALGADVTAPFTGTTTLTGDVSINANGSFVYVPPRGVKNTVDTFTYTLGNAVGGQATAVVSITITNDLLWYVHNNPAGEALNPADGGGSEGRSNDPFDTLAQADFNAALSAAGDFIHVFAGDGTTVGHTAGIELTDNQKLIGHRAATLAVGAVTVQTPGFGNRPKVDHTGGSAGVTVTNRTGVEIRHLEITGDTHGVDVTATSGTRSVLIANSVLVGNTSSHGIRVASSGTADLSIAFSDNTVESGDTAAQSFRGADFSGTSFNAGLGTLTVTDFTNPSVNDTASAVGTGIRTDTVTFDADTGTAGFQQVAATTLTVGDSGGGLRTMGAGVELINTQGNLQLGTVDIFNSGGVGMRANGTGPLMAASGFGLTVASGTINTSGAPAFVVDPLTLATTFTSVTSSGSATNGVSITGAAGTFSAGAASSITGSAGASFQIVGGTVSSTYSGGITQGNNAPAVSVSGGHATGTVTFQTGTISATNGTGLQFDNADGIYNFNGTTTLAGGDAGIDILNGSAGTFSFSANTSITSPSGTAFNADSSSANIDYLGSVTQANAATGVRLSSNTGTATFRGGLSLTTSTVVGFTASGGGTVNVCANDDCAAGGAVVNTVATTTATALSVSGFTIGTNGLTFRSISAGTGAGTAGNGIVLDTTGSNAGLTVTGTGGAGTGGTIRNKTGANGSTSAGIGIYLNATQDVSLTSMQLNDFDNFAIRGTSVTRFTLVNSTINGTNGNSAGDDEGSVSFDNLLDSATFTNNTISGGHEDNIVVTNTAMGSVLDRMTVSGGTIGLNNLNDGILVEAQSNAVLNLTVTGASFLGAAGDHIQVNGLDTSSMDVVIRDNAFTNTHGSSLGSGVTLGGGSAGSNITMTYDISGTMPNSQTFRDSVASAITVNPTNGIGSVTGTIRNNKIGVSGVANSGSSGGGAGIAVGCAGLAGLTHTATIDRNDIDGVFGTNGVIDLNTQVDCTLNATITNNAVNELNGFTLAAIYTFSGGAAAADTARICADIRLNTFDGSGSFGFDVFIDQLGGSSASYNFPGYGGGMVPGASPNALDAFLSGQNTLVQPSIDSGAAQNVTGAGASCP